jgi:hypothetical protein
MHIGPSGSIRASFTGALALVRRVDSNMQFGAASGEVLHPLSSEHDEQICEIADKNL